jgi:hypothetical protein
LAKGKNQSYKFSFIYLRGHFKTAGRCPFLLERVPLYFCFLSRRLFCFFLSKKENGVFVFMD